MILTNFEQYITKVKGAIHVGANIGEERHWYNNQGFKNVIWFEPNKDLYPTLLENIKQYSEQMAFNIGIHDWMKKGNLHISNNAGQSSSLLELGVHVQYHPEVYYIGEQQVDLARLDDFITATGIDIKDFNFLNVDVQGTELNVLKSMGNLLGTMDYLYLEVNDEELYKGCALLPAIDSYVEQFSFIRLKTKITKAHWGDAFYIKEATL